MYIACPSCGSSNCKLNGHILNGKQNHQCKDCSQQFVLDPSKKYIIEEQKQMINKLLLERISLAGFCRVMQVSQPWLLEYVSELYAAQPDDLCAQLPSQQDMQAYLANHFEEKAYELMPLKKNTTSLEYVLLSEENQKLSLEEPVGDFIEIIAQQPLGDSLPEQVYESRQSLSYEFYRFEADEMWSFLGNKANKQWIWLVMNTANRQIIAFHVGARGKEEAQLFWNNIPDAVKESSLFFTDFWKAYQLVIEEHLHHAAGKEQGFTNHIERFNNTLRQGCSRLVRETLSFSKKLDNHIGAIKYFISHYNKLLYYFFLQKHENIILIL